MAVYLGTIILVGFFSLMVDYYRSHENYSKILSSIFIFLTTIVLIFVAGFRWYVGTDYGNYVNLYPSYKENLWSSILNFNEPGIRIIANTAQLIYDDYSMFFLIASIITIGLIVRTIAKYSKNFFLSIFIYIFIGAWHGSFNVVRQYIACAILFSGHKYIIERKFYKYLIIVIISSAFHISALPMIALYFIPQTKITLKRVILWALSTVFILISYDFFLEIINNFLVLQNRSLIIDSYVTEEVSILRVMVMFAPLILYYFITRKKLLEQNDHFYINLLFFNAVLYIATINSAYLARFAIYTNIYTTLAFPRLFIGVDKKLKIIIQYAAILLYSLYWFADIQKTQSLFIFNWIFER